MSSTPCALILAAGQGRRYRQMAGATQDKLCAPCQGRDGQVRPVLEHVLRNLPDSIEQRWLVTLPDRSEVRALGQRFGCQVLQLESAGMGQSIAAAVAASGEQAGWLMVLGDMPFILPQTVVQVIQGLGDGDIRVPVCSGQYGHPVVFGRLFGSALKGLSGDCGARSLFASGRVVPVAVEDRGVLWDVDTPEALRFD